MRFIKYIKRILGLDLNYLLEDEQEDKQCENEIIIEQTQALSRAISSAGISISNLQKGIGVKK